MIVDFRRLPILAVTLLVLAPLAAQGQTLAIRNGDRAVTLSMAEMSAMPAARFQTDDGEKVAYEGVPLAELLKRVDVTFGQAFRGPRLATYLLAGGADGYRVVIALPEVDSDFSRHPPAIVALRRDGKPLSERDGPLQLILPGDKRHARWVRGLTSLSVHVAAQVP